MDTVYELIVNGTRRSVRADPGATLLEVLREQLDLIGTRYGCGEGQCGACTVLLDGAAARSCLTAISAVGDRPVTTIEGLADGERLHPLQEAFLEVGALQCGYCTSGMIVAAAGLLRASAHPSREEIVQRMRGNVCRCGCYPRIVEAIERASRPGSGGAR